MQGLGDTGLELEALYFARQVFYHLSQPLPYTCALDCIFSMISLGLGNFPTLRVLFS
jgi:hypothetical protein